MSVTALDNLLQNKKTPPLNPHPKITAPKRGTYRCLINVIHGWRGWARSWGTSRSHSAGAALASPSDIGAVLSAGCGQPTSSPTCLCPSQPRPPRNASPACLRMGTVSSLRLACPEPAPAPFGSSWRFPHDFHVGTSAGFQREPC